MNIKHYIDSLIARSIQRQFFDDDYLPVQDRIKDLLVELERCADIIPKFGKKMDKKIGKARYLFSIKKPLEAAEDLLEIKRVLKKALMLGTFGIDDSVLKKAITTINSLVELSKNIG